MDDIIKIIHTLARMDFWKSFIICIVVIFQLGAIVYLWNPANEKTLTLCIFFAVMIFGEMLTVLVMTNQNRFMEKIKGK